MMRDAIRQKLISSVPGISGRVYEPHAAGVKTKRPYLVLRLGSEDNKSPWINYQRDFEIWPCVDRTTFGDLDQLAGEVVAALHLMRIADNNDAFTVTYEGVDGDDAVVQEWDVLTRCLRFAVAALHQKPETEDDDPWLRALISWTGQTMGQDFCHVYASRWPKDYVRPAVLWRMTGADAAEAAHGLYRVSKKYTGHVIAHTPNQEIAAAMQLIKGLRQAIKIPLDITDRRYLLVNDPVANFQADALASGQISVTLSRFVNRPYEYTPMEHVYVNKLDGGIRDE